MADEPCYIARSHGLLVTLHRTSYRDDFIPKILHEFVVHRQFGCGVEEVHQDGALHVHLVLWCDKPFTWVKANIHEQTGCPKIHLKPLYTYFAAIEACAYLCKQRVPHVWSPDEAITAKVKKDITMECSQYQARQNTIKGLKVATEQLRRVEKVWCKPRPRSELRLVRELWDPSSSEESSQPSDQ